VTARPFVVARRADGGEGGHSLGLFALTAGALGLVADVGALVQTMLPLRTVYEPDPARHALYEELFGVYHSLSRSLAGDFERLAAISGGAQRISP
jgi:sugar (pentulose or hexulose) kinase